MKQKTFTILTLITTLSLTFLSGCGAKNTTPTNEVPTNAVVDIEAIFKDISTKIIFEDTMEIVSDDYSEMLLSIPATMYEDCILYMGGGATAEELLIFKSAKKEQISEIKNSLTTHLADQKAAFEGYDPEELKILSSAIIASNDSIVIYCVSQDANAAKNAITAYCTEIN